jgi:hypothetical protein
MRIVPEKTLCYHYFVFVCISWLKLEGEGGRGMKCIWTFVRSGVKVYAVTDSQIVVWYIKKPNPITWEAQRQYNLYFNLLFVLF